MWHPRPPRKVMSTLLHLPIMISTSLHTCKFTKKVVAFTLLHVVGDLLWVPNKSIIYKVRPFTFSSLQGVQRCIRFAKVLIPYTFCHLPKLMKNKRSSKWSYLSPQSIFYVISIRECRWNMLSFTFFRVFTHVWFECYNTEVVSKKLFVNLAKYRSILSD